MQSKTPKNERIKIRIQPLYSIIVDYFLGICCLIMILLPKLFSWEQSDLLITLLYYFCFFVLSIICFCIGTLNIQIGILDKDTIIIRDLFQIIAVIKREKNNQYFYKRVKLSEIKEIVDYENRYKINFYFPNKSMFFICQKDLIVQGTILLSLSLGGSFSFSVGSCN